MENKTNFYEKYEKFFIICFKIKQKQNKMGSRTGDDIARTIELWRTHEQVTIINHKRFTALEQRSSNRPN